MIRALLIGGLLVALAVVPFSRGAEQVRIGSKKFTEAVILGEMLVHLAREVDVSILHYAELGGTRILYEALRKGEIDVYVEYTGTLQQEIFRDKELGHDEMVNRLAADGIRMSEPLGFNNTYAIAVLRETAQQYDLQTISDLAQHPELRLGFGNEFMDRGDGWRNLRKEYGLSHEKVKGLDHDLAYRQLELGEIDAMDIYTTDAKVQSLGLALLEDDRGYFPRYDAVLLYSDRLERDYPQLVEQFRKLEGQITDEQMSALNAAAELERTPETRVAADFLEEQLGIVPQVREVTTFDRLVQYTLEHLDLVRKSLIPAIFVAIPLGVVAAKYAGVGQVILGAVGIVQTIPALALLVLLMPPLAYLGMGTVGVGASTAILALFLYSLLPIVRNTATGLTSISQAHRESALALGLSPLYRLWHIELPLASPAILAGIKTAAVINVGFATLGALIGSGGYGQPILTGIRLNDTGLIMLGALPAAGLALLFQGLFEVVERWFVPQGLRLKPSA